jgi:hypothetical protein
MDTGLRRILKKGREKRERRRVARFARPRFYPSLLSSEAAFPSFFPDF